MASNNSRKNLWLAFQLYAFGAAAGIFYVLIFFGFIKSLIVGGLVAGLFISMLYVILEFRLFSLSFQKLTFLQQYISRTIAYTVLFIISLAILSILHAWYICIVADDDLKLVLFEDYFPLWPMYVLYATIAATVFQAVRMMADFEKKNTNGLNQPLFKNKNATILVFKISSDPGNEEENINLLNNVFEQIKNTEPETIAFYESGNLKIAIPGKCISEENVKSLCNAILKKLEYDLNKTTLQLGYGCGEVKFSGFAQQIIFRGTALKLAEEQMRPLSYYSSSNPAPNISASAA